ncbi:MAG TPA: molybdopterin biosynthesis protein MoeB [Bacteroidetes bacterium]|nr:molybdopterin biosynthesis protein MoeB [Bacteroidota bacterium]
MIIDLENKYSRFELINWWDQSVLKNSKIMVIGAGALGNEIVKNLLMLGVGEIFIVDMDNVEKSNLTRSVFFRESDIGKNKAEVIYKNAQEINPDVKINFYNGNIMNLGLGVFNNFDLIICGLDNREARMFVNQSCRKINKIWIDGAIEVLNGVVRVFHPVNFACYECTMNETDYILMNKRKSCLLLGIEDIQQGKIPTTPTIASIIAAVQVQEAVKILHKFDEKNILFGKGFVYSGVTNESYTVEYQINESCLAHYNFDDISNSNLNFNTASISDIFQFADSKFNFKNCDLIFNNEIVYELYDADENYSKEFFGNLNLLKLDEIKDGEKILKLKSFHSLKNNGELFDKLKNKTLKELKIPENDILTIRNKNSEKYISFFS